MSKIHSWMSWEELFLYINDKDLLIAPAVRKCSKAAWELIDVISWRMKLGWRLFYIGAGTSWRLGVLDASECPPTFGVDANTVIWIIAWWDKALRNSVENAEDVSTQARYDLQNHNISEKDIVIWVAASWTTPYVIWWVKDCKANGILTGCISTSPWTPLWKHVDFPIEVDVWEAFIKDSSRMSPGTAQKMVLNAISTSIMVQLERTLGNKMIHMKLSNNKLNQRGIDMLVEEFGLEADHAKTLLWIAGNVAKAREFLLQNPDAGLIDFE